MESFVHNANLVGYLLLCCGVGNYEKVVSRIREVLQVNVETEKNENGGAGSG